MKPARLLLRRAGIIIYFGGMASLALLIGTGLAGGRWNTTPSVPVGLYWQVKASIAKGAFVLVCPPDTKPFQQARERTYIDIGPCPGGYGRMMKQIAGMGGDTIAVRSDGVYVNNVRLPDSTPMARDPQGRPMSFIDGATYTLAPHQLLLMGTNSMSFDSRYYGPVGEDMVLSVIKPIYTWKE